MPKIEEMKEQILSENKCGNVTNNERDILIAALAHYEAMKVGENGLRPCPCCKGKLYFSISTVRCEDCPFCFAAVQGEAEAIRALNTRRDPVLDVVCAILKGESE